MASFENKLYNLIRERAGSEMLYKAEAMKMYEQVSDFLGDNLTSEAVSVAVEFHKEYPIGAPVTAMGHINLVDVCSINEKELEDLPWIYVHMLETLVSQDDLASKVLTQKIAASPAAAWRQPLPEGVSNADAFAHIFNDWVSQNDWIESFESWAHSNDEDDISYNCQHDSDNCPCL